MAGSVRVIPRLDIKGPNLVKGIHLEGLRVLGRPERFARRYYEGGADELIYLDVVASLYGRNTILGLIESISREVFIPLTVGGGLRSLEDIRAALMSGADKVALNTAAVRDPALISRAAERFGSSTILVSIEAKRQPGGGYEAYTDNGRVRTGLDALAWAARAAALGAGEIILTSIDREGTGRGLDLELTRAVSAAVPVPVIACGGAGEVGHLAEAVRDAGADAVAVASMLHYRSAEELGADAAGGPEGNRTFLESRQRFSGVRGADVAGIKAALKGHGIFCRDAAEA